MNDEIALWNMLHDGGLAEAKGIVPGAVEVRVEISYLADLLSNDGDSIWITLHGCTLFRYTLWEASAPITCLAEIEASSPEILSVEEMDGVARVLCVEGMLELQYKDVSCRLDNGRFVSVKEICAAACRYWDRWSKSRNT